MRNKTITLILTILLLIIIGCGVAADKPDLRCFANGAKVKFKSNINLNDKAAPGVKFKDYKTPFIVQSSEWQDRWNEYWYHLNDQTGKTLYIADRMLAKY